MAARGALAGYAARLSKLFSSSASPSSNAAASSCCSSFSSSGVELQYFLRAIGIGVEAHAGKMAKEAGSFPNFLRCRSGSLKGPDIACQQPWTLSSITPGLSGIFNATSRRDTKDFKDFMIVPKEITRGFAKTVAMPPNMQKPMKLRLYMGSPGVIGEPYKKPPAPLSILRRWFTKEGWTRRKQSFMGMIKTSYTIAKLRQKTKGYSQQRFYQEASDLYKQINVALAEGERTILRQLATDKVFSVMKNELKHRESSWAKVKWEMVGPINNIRTLQGRLIGVDKNNHDNAFVQLTLRIRSKQKFAAYDKNGKLVAGDPDKELLVEDYWVFEKPLLLTEAKWKLCGRLTV